MTYQNLFLIAKEVEKGLAPEQKENVASDLFSLAFTSKGTFICASEPFVNCS